LLDPIQSRHLNKVLRLKVGDKVQIFDGKGLLADAQIETITREGVRVRLLKKTHIPPATSGRIILAVSMARGERFEWMVEKCTELGADHIVAVQFQRTVKMGNAASIDRCHKIALAAAKQCGRVYLPILSGPESFEEAVCRLRQQYAEAELLYGDPEGQWLEMTSDSTGRADRIVCIGPEGGFSEEEIGLLEDYKARPVRVNRHVLRIETAAIAFTAALRLQSSLPEST